MKAAWLVLMLAAMAWARQEPDRQLKEAGVCARCHVISVVEWGVAKHWQAGTNCIACHGKSEGHVVDERNNVKPERMPRGAAVAGLCLTCHASGCGKTKSKAGCEGCHHVHALIDPKAPPPPAAAGTARAAAPRKDTAAGAPASIEALGLKLVLVRGGFVELGSDELANARPVHRVRVEPFYLGEKEVTERQWQALMGARAATDLELPAAGVSWQDAQAFLAKLNAKAPGGGFRLPTEAEWEFAARAGAGEGDALELTAPRRAGAGKPNALGLYDLRGNVWEWCSSLDRSYPYDAADGREAAGAGLRILRGGGYADPASWATPATRHAERAERRLPWYGFRVARGLR